MCAANPVQPKSTSFSYLSNMLTILNQPLNRYRTLVRTHKKAYQTFTRHEKTKLAETLVNKWQAQNPPGRFLEKDDTTGYWFCIGEKSARRKTSQLLREGAAKIRRELKTESDMKKKRAKTPLPALVPLSQATQNSAERPSYKKSQAVTPTVLAKPSTENALLSPIQFRNNTRGNSGGSNNYYNNVSTPLKQITPAQANRAAIPHATPYPYYRCPASQHTWHHYTPAPYYSPVSVAAANRPVFTFGSSVPPPTKTPVSKREESTTSLNQVTPDNDSGKPSSNIWTSALTTSPDPSSDETPLELELNTFQASWDFESDILENCGDISSLVDDIEKDEHTIKMVDDLSEQGPSHPGMTSLDPNTVCPELPQKTLFRPSPPRARFIRQLSPPQLSPSSITKTNPDTRKAEEQPMHLYDSTWGLFSFNSVDSLDAASPDSFDMDGIVSPDSHSINDGDGGLPSAVDILNELDKELEAEFLLPLSTS